MTTPTKTREQRQVLSLVEWHDKLAEYVAVIGGAAAHVRGFLDTLENQAVFERRVKRMNKGFQAMMEGTSDVINAMAPIVDLADFFDRNPDTPMAAAIVAVNEVPLRDMTKLEEAKDRLASQFWFLRACTEGPKGDA